MPDARWAPRRIAVLFAVGVVIVGALLPLGGGEATRIYLTDSNAMRASGTIAVDVRLQLQGGFAPSEIRALLLAMNESWSIPKIVFYLDPAYPVAGPLDRINGLIDHLRPALSERHFAGRFEIAHGAFARMALQVKGDSILFAGVEDGFETLDQKFQAEVAHIRNGVAPNG